MEVSMAAKRPSRSKSKIVIRGAGGSPPPPLPANFPNARSSGLFSAPADAKFIDWAVMNGGIVGHWIRVKVYKCPVGAAKIAIAGPTAVFLNARVAAHEAVSLSADRTSIYYEVVVEDEDMRMQP